MEHSLLAVYAHPDDEAFGTGGTIARYAGEGVKTYLVCATRGEVGEISDPSLATPETLGQVREGELRCAAETMGVAELIFLDYRDSGMAGTDENRDPRAFINAPADEVIATLVTIIRRLRPQVVATFEPNGGYGHPDHIAIHRHTVAAFHAAGDGQYRPELGQSWQASRLFYTAIPRSFFIEMRQQLEALGEDTSEFDRFDDPADGLARRPGSRPPGRGIHGEFKMGSAQLPPHAVRAWQPVPPPARSAGEGSHERGALCTGLARAAARLAAWRFIR